jgi:formylglycine-generating enzyme required for sulfatase activity
MSLLFMTVVNLGGPVATNEDAKSPKHVMSRSNAVLDLSKTMKLKWRRHIVKESQGGSTTREPIVCSTIGMVMQPIPAGTYEIDRKAVSEKVNALDADYRVNPLDIDVQPVFEKEEVDGFYLSEIPVTNAQFELFDPAHVRTHPEMGDDAPVIDVPWFAAVRFCLWLSEWEGRLYRLPTELEWEYAACGGARNKLYPWGDEFTPNNKPMCYAHIGGRPGRLTHPGEADGEEIDKLPLPVKKFPPNEYGLYDMVGSIWQWVEEWLVGPGCRGTCQYPTEVFRKKAPRRPPGLWKMAKGGAHFSSPPVCTVYARGWDRPSHGEQRVGFRVAMCEPLLDGPDFEPHPKPNRK